MSQRLLLLSLITCLSACSDNVGEQKLDLYAERLGNVLEAYHKEIPKPGEASSRLIYPDRKLLVRAPELPSSKIDLLDFLSLYGCRLQGVVAEANSALGKVAQDSQRLINTLQFLEHAPECVESLRAEEKTELADLLADEIERKRLQLPLQIGLATLGSSEFKEFWSPPLELENYPDQQSLEPLQAIGRFAELSAEWQSGRYEVGQAEIETLLSQVRQGDGGALLRAFELLDQRLEALNLYLDKVLSSSEVCQRSDLYSSQILRNVVQSFFIEGVQVWAAQLNRRQYAIDQSLAPLEEALSSSTSDLFRSWMASRKALFERVKTRLQSHVAKVQVLLVEERLKQHCEVMGIKNL